MQLAMQTYADTNVHTCTHTSTYMHIHMNGDIKQPCTVVMLCQTVGTGSVGQAALGLRWQLGLPSPEG